jgi:predicted MFS family arabinose efflux permease
VITSVRERLGASAAALRAVVENRALRRVEIARPAAALAVSAANVVFLVIAFEAEGTGGVATVLAVRMIVIAAAMPFGSLLGDRFLRHRIIAAADLVRAAALAVAGLEISSESSLAAILAASIPVGLVGTAAAPARAALVPALARTPGELTAVNVVASTSGSLVAFVGPALGGLVLGLVSPAAGFAFAAAVSLLSALVVIRVEEPRDRSAAGAAPRRKSHFALAGMREIVTDPPTRLVILIHTSQMLVGGVLAVLIVSAAVEALGSPTNVGYLYSALGLGGLFGSLAALALPERSLGRVFAFGVLLWGIPIALVGAWPALVPAFVLLAVSATADSAGDVASLTLLQRRIPPDVLARVAGASGTLMLVAATLGNFIAPLLIETVGVRWSFAIAGGALPLLAPLWWRPAVRLDASAPPAMRALRSSELFAPLPLPTLEALAQRAEELEVAAGETVIRQGESGDRFYLVADGQVEFMVDGAVVGTGSRGDYFGEIALLRDEPRTATVRVTQDAYLFALGREDFLRAVRGEADALAAAEELAAARLRGGRPAVHLA